MPTIPRALTSKVRKRMEKIKVEIREEKRHLVHIQHEGDHLWLIGSSLYTGSADELKVS